MMFNKKKKKPIIFSKDTKVISGGSRVGKTEPPKKRNVSKYKVPPPPVFVPKDKYLFITTFQNGEQHRVRQLKVEGKPLHFISKIMAEGSVDERVFYPPSMVKKIHWEEV